MAVGGESATCRVFLALALAAALPVHAEAPAEERRVLLGAGAGLAVASAIGPLSPRYVPGAHGSVWASFPIGAIFGLRPSLRLYGLGDSFGGGPGARLDFELAAEFTLRTRWVDVVLALVTAATFRASSVFDLRALGLGLSPGLQGRLVGPLGWYVRTTHRLTVTIAEGLLVHQFEAGLLVRL